MNSIDISGRLIGAGQPCFIIAEAGVNHNGSLDMARQLVDEAVLAGVDAIKFQTFKAERLVSIQAPKAKYQLQTTGTSESQLEMIKKLELSFDAFKELNAYCQKKGILFMSTPFDEESVDFLFDLGIAVFKIPSGEITNTPFLEYVSRKGKPLIISTGMSYLGEVETALQTIKKTRNCDVVLLHCVSNYPADPADVNLHAMKTMMNAFKVPVGYSDHTIGVDIPLAAVALGACVLEKHFTLDCGLPGPDHKASLEPEDLRRMVLGIRIVESALGHGRKEPAASEMDNLAVARRSLVAAHDISSGELINLNMIKIKRPGNGLPPALLPFIVGRTASVDIPVDTLLTMDMFG